MDNSMTFCGNELLTGISILSVLRLTQELEITKCLLIEPMLNHKDSIKALKNSNAIVRSIEELIIKQQVAFSNFNDRFQESLVLSINSIMLFSQLGLLKINNNILQFTGTTFDFEEKSLGKTAKNRIAASKKLAEILGKETSANLYLSLRIEL